METNWKQVFLRIGVAAVVVAGGSWLYQMDWQRGWVPMKAVESAASITGACASDSHAWEARIAASELDYAKMRQTYHGSTDLQKDAILAGLKGKHIVAAGKVDQVEKTLFTGYQIRADDLSLEGDFDPGELVRLGKGHPVRFEGDVVSAVGILGEPAVRVRVVCLERKG